MITFHAEPQEPLDNEDIHTLFSDIELILRNADVILQNEEYRNIHVQGIGIDGIYIGHTNLFLGDLVALWRNNSPWRSGNKFYYHLGGSPLSGMSFCTYWQNGKIGCDRNNPSFGTLFRPACEVIKNSKEPDGCIKLSFPQRQPSQLSHNDLLARLSTTH